jgi:uncharacterized membrane protein HdeD (DUF308 family)
VVEQRFTLPLSTEASMGISTDSAQMSAALRESVRHHWVMFLIEGIVLVVLGILAVLVPQIASLAATLVFGWILLLSGIVGLISTIRARQAPGFTWSLISALVAIVAGILLLSRPVAGVLSLTAVLLAFLTLEGIVSILFALEHRRGLSGRWGWMLASGILDIVLAAILFANLPGSALWAIGLIVGVNLLFGGWALILMALAARAITSPP